MGMSFIENLWVSAMTCHLIISAMSLVACKIKNRGPAIVTLVHYQWFKKKYLMIKTPNP
jgi:hypothetical protein